MDKKLATAVQTECAAALAAVAAKHGLSVKAHGGSLAEISMVLKFEFKTNDADAIRASEETTFRAYASLFGLEPEDYRRAFVANRKAYTVVGFDLKRRKYPILVEDADGKRTCFTETVVPAIVAARAVS